MANVTRLYLKKSTFLLKKSTIWQTRANYTRLYFKKSPIWPWILLASLIILYALRCLQRLSKLLKIAELSGLRPEPCWGAQSAPKIPSSKCRYRRGEVWCLHPASHFGAQNIHFLLQKKLIAALASDHRTQVYLFFLSWILLASLIILYALRCLQRLSNWLKLLSFRDSAPNPVGGLRAP